MTELEKLKRAQEYIEKLSRGINPLNDFPVPADDTINYDRISRCLSYVSDVLYRDIEREETQYTVRPSPESENKKNDFTFPIEKRNEFQFSDMPVTVTEIVNRINVMFDSENNKKLKSMAVFEWLTEAGILEMVEKEDGKNIRMPTALGLGIGVDTELRTGQNGEYTAILYNRDAQQFIIDNIDAVIEINNRGKARRFRKRNEKPWTKEQDEYLQIMRQNDVSLQDMAESLMRSENEVDKRLKYLGF